jgi:hypothetical protein
MQELYMLADARVFFKPGRLQNQHSLPACQTVLPASTLQTALCSQSFHADGADRPAKHDLKTLTYCIRLCFKVSLQI